MTWRFYDLDAADFYGLSPILNAFTSCGFYGIHLSAVDFMVLLNCLMHIWNAYIWNAYIWMHILNAYIWIRDSRRMSYEPIKK